MELLQDQAQAERVLLGMNLQKLGWSNNFSHNSDLTTNVLWRCSYYVVAAMFYCWYNVVTALWQYFVHVDMDLTRIWSLISQVWKWTLLWTVIVQWWYCSSDVILLLQYYNSTVTVLCLPWMGPWPWHGLDQELDNMISKVYSIHQECEVM